MRKKSKKGLRGFQLNIQGYGGNSYFLERVAKLEKALARRPRKFQIDLIGRGEIAADWALLIRSILLRRASRTQLITNARSSLQGGSVLVWLLGDRRIIRDDARVFFRRVDMSETNEADENEVWKESDLKYMDSFSETDPEDSDYVKVLRLIDDFLPVKELGGKVINVPVLRQFGLVENEKLDRFLATAFGGPQESNANSANEPRQKRVRADAKVSKSE
jgi:hypothetical protein